MEPRWLVWGRALQTLAQNGLAYSTNVFDSERYSAVREIAADILATYTEVSPERLADLFGSEAGYATPKVDVRGAIFQGERILLVRELLDEGRWTLPGGWADVSDSPSQAVLREIREESGYEARVVKLAALFDRRLHGHPPLYFTIYKLFFLCEITGGAPAESAETGGVGFFAEADLPELSIGRVTPGEIHLLFEHHRNPGLPTAFD